MSQGPMPPHDGLGTWDYVMVVAYLTAMMLMAIYFSRRQRSTEEFFLASRNMPWFAVGLSIIATLLSTLTYLAAPGEVVKNGIGFFWGLLAVPFNLLTVLVLLVPFFMRLRLTSAYEYLERRFNYSARLLAAILFILLRFGWMAVVVYASSMALAEMTRPDVTGLEPAAAETAFREHVYFIIGFVGVFATVYTAVGGIRAVIWTDVIQFLVLFSGALLTLGYVIVTTGTGVAQWWELATEHRAAHTQPLWFSWDPTERVTILTACMAIYFWTVCTQMCDQVVLQRYFTTRSLSAARRSYILSALAEVSMNVLLALCGLALLGFYLQHADYLPANIDLASRQHADAVFPYFISHQLPTGVGGLILSALIAAAMSSIDSGVNSVSTVVTTDIGHRCFPRIHASISPLAMARVLTLTVGCMVTGLAYGVDLIAQRVNILELMPKGFNMFLGPLAGLFFIGMFVPRCRARSAITAVLGGLGGSFIWSYWYELATLTDGWPVLQNIWSFWGQTFGDDAVPTFTLAVAFPFLLTVVLGTVLGLVLEPGGRHRGQDYVWTAVMGRDERPR